MDGRDILHYRMVRALGSGASGETWLARDMRLHRDVVLKFIADAHGVDRRTWLEEEARSLAALAHPGIATVHALENDGETWFLVTEYIDGETLRELLGLGPLPLPEVMSMALALADALRHAHARAVVHRDIKPENIVVDVDGGAHLVDFGIASRASRAGASAPGVYGTDGYMSPEQERGEPADPRSDVYAFGVVMVEMLAGARPRDLPVPVPQALRARGVPEPLVRVVTHCLSPSRARRYRDGGALCAVLDGAAVAMGMRAPAPAPPRRTAGAAYAVAGVALVAVAWLLPWHGRGPQAPGTRVMVAPLDTRDAGGDAPYVGGAFARAMTLDLARARPLAVMPVATTSEPGMREARARGAQWLVSGRLVRTGEFVRVRLDLTDVRNGKLQWSDVAQGLDTELSGMASRLAARVAGALHARTESQYDYYLSSVPNPSLASSPLVSEALGAVRRFDSATALASTARLVREFPDAPEARVLRTWAWMHAGWDEGARAPTKAAFEASLDTLRRVDPRNPWADVFAATVQGREGANAPAVEAFTRVLERSDLTPGARAHVLALRGQSERELGDSTAALLDLETALRLDGLDVVTLVILSDALGTFGHPAEALLRARQALALSPDMGFANWMLAQACGRLGDWSGAVDAAHRAATTQPRQEFFAFEALALEHAGRGADADRVEREALSHPENDWGDEYLARRHALRGERQQGLRLLERSVALGWRDPETATLPEFVSLHDDPRFLAILARVRPAPAHLAARSR